MEKLKILVLGDGLLGSELVKQTGWDYISRKKDNFNINDFNSTIPLHYNVIINCIAHTDTYSIEKDLHWQTNYVFVDKLISFCNDNNIKLVHISTDYLYSNSIPNASENDVPVHLKTWYGYTKLLGDGLVQLKSKNYLIIRCSHKPNPFPYQKAWNDQIGNFDYVDEIGRIIIDMVNNSLEGLYNVGTETKSILDLASKTNVVESVPAPKHVPKNITMDLNKFKKNMADAYNPFFSVAIPTYGYNGRGVEFLEFSLEKLMNQTFKDFEVILSDHSTDNTIKNVYDKWASILNIKYYKNEYGRGIISPNINNAMRFCKGAWIKVLFQDDFLYDDNSLRIQADILMANPNTKWAMTTFYHSNDGFNFYRLFYPHWNDLIWTGNNTMGCPSGMTIKNENLTFFNEGLNWLMDVDYYKRMFDIHGKPLIINDITYVNRTWGERLTDTIGEDLKKREFEMLKKRYA